MESTPQCALCGSTEQVESREPMVDDYGEVFIALWVKCKRCKRLVYAKREFAQVKVKNA